MLSNITWPTLLAKEVRLSTLNSAPQCKLARIGKEVRAGFDQCTLLINISWMQPFEMSGPGLTRRRLRLCGAKLQPQQSDRLKTTRMGPTGVAPLQSNMKVQGVRPFVVEQHGRLGEAAHALILHLAGSKARAAALVGQTQYQVAPWKTLQETRTHIARCPWAALRESGGGAAYTPLGATTSMAFGCKVPFCQPVQHMIADSLVHSDRKRHNCFSKCAELSYSNSRFS